MAEAYKIIIQTESSGSSGKKKPIAGDNNNAQETKKQDKEKPMDVKAYVAYRKYIAPFVKQGIQYRISTVELRTGGSERQARAQSMYSIASQIENIGSSIYLGFRLGNAPGAIIGGLMSVATTVIGYAQQQNTINLQRSLENQTISMLQERSGATSGNRR